MENCTPTLTIKMDYCWW